MHRLTILAIALFALACEKGQTGVMKLPDAAPPTDQARDLPPVALNAQTPVEYPPALFDQGIEGTVILRLYADTAGVLVIDSTRVQESSGFPALDSAAVAAAPNLRFAPARHDGKPVAASFLQPIYFRHPGVGGTTP
ncbi:MAG: energy transducer TonB [Gemmatimonadales bacterium]|nr:MAG: energy transducer TonB [Gemmatimonadales bacterium]